MTNAVGLGRVTVRQLERQHFLPNPPPYDYRTLRTTTSDRLMSNIIPESHIFAEIDKNGLARPSSGSGIEGGSFTTTARNMESESQPKNFYASFEFASQPKILLPFVRSRKACHKRRCCEIPQRRDTPRPERLGMPGLIVYSSLRDRITEE